MCKHTTPCFARHLLAPERVCPPGHGSQEFRNAMAALGWKCPTFGKGSSNGWGADEVCDPSMTTPQHRAHCHTCLPSVHRNGGKALA